MIYFIEKIENMIHFWMYEVAPNILEARLLGSMNIIDAAVVGIPHKENGEVSRFNLKDFFLYSLQTEQAEKYILTLNINEESGVKMWCAPSGQI